MKFKVGDDSESDICSFNTYGISTEYHKNIIEVFRDRELRDEIIELLNLSQNPVLDKNNSNKLDITKPVQLVNGTPVELVCTDLNADYPLLGVFMEDGSKTSRRWPVEGGYSPKQLQDLINVPEYHYINIYWDKSDSIFKTRRIADLNATPDRIACIKFQEEQFDK